jgi:hypothetical protein
LGILAFALSLADGVSGILFPKRTKSSTFIVGERGKRVKAKAKVWREIEPQIGKIPQMVATRKPPAIHHLRNLNDLRNLWFRNL